MPKANWHPVQILDGCAVRIIVLAHARQKGVAVIDTSHEHKNAEGKEAPGRAQKCSSNVFAQILHANHRLHELDNRKDELFHVNAGSVTQNGPRNSKNRQDGGFAASGAVRLCLTDALDSSFAARLSLAAVLEVV